MLHWREEEFRGILSINVPLKTGVSLLVKPVWWEMAVGKWLYDDEFPSEAKGSSSQNHRMV